jgi:CubicO group peptidase (beta-lactamase class C family)
MRRRDFLLQSTETALGLSLLPIIGCSTQQQDRPPPTETPLLGALRADLESKVPMWMTEYNVPGVSIAVIQNAEIAWRRAFGVKDVASNVPVDADTMFEAASMSKPVFAYVVMKLCETGVMDLDAPLTAYTSERFLKGDARLDLITARHVLSHTSGFQNWRSEKEPLSIHFAPGEKYMYSGEGYNYLQTVVTHLLGQEFEAYMKARLLDPLGMTASGYAWTSALGKRMARPHDPNGKPIDNKKSDSAGVARYGSAGALLTTPTDYAKFVIEVINPKPSDAVRLTPQSVKEMLRPHVKLEGGQYPASWALGWQIFHNANRDFIYHGGDNEGFHCGACASIAGKSGFVVMTNGDKGTWLLRNLISADSMQQYLSG